MQISNFSKNLQTFIFSNNISHQRVADLINEEMAKLDACNERVIMANDVWTIVGRGSTPRNHLVMVAIAKVIGKSLEDLIVKVYDMPDLYRADLHLPDLRDCGVSMCCIIPEECLPVRSRNKKRPLPPMEPKAHCEELPTPAPIEPLFYKLDERDRDFVLDLMSTVDFEDFGKVYLSLLVQVDMPLDGYIDLWIYYDNQSGNPVRLTYDWEDLAHYMSNYDYDPRNTIAGFVVESFLSVLTNNLQIAAHPSSVTRYYDMDAAAEDFLLDEIPDFNNSYLLKIQLNLWHGDLLFLYEHSLERAKQHLAELEAQQEQLEQENNKKED